MLTATAANRLRYQLLEIPDLCTQAYEDLQLSGGRGSGMPTGSRTPPLPLREDILSLLGPAAAGDVHDPYGDQTGPVPVSAVLSSWCQAIWGFPCPSITTACGILLRHHTQAVAADYAPVYAGEIAQVHYRLTLLARTYMPPLSLRCPGCQQFTLTPDPGRGYLCCDPDCHIRLLPDLYDHLAEEQINKTSTHNAVADTAS